MSVLSLDIPPEWEQGLIIVYDGECPFCSRYAEFTRLRAEFGEVHLMDARDHLDLTRKLLLLGFDLDDGMAAIAGKRLYFGSEAVAFLARNSRAHGVLDSAFLQLHRSNGRAAKVYPLLRASRNALLWLLGRSKINKRKASAFTLDH